MTLNEQFELIDQLLESGTLKIIDDKLYTECDNLDELLEGIGDWLAKKLPMIPMNKSKAITKAALNTDENKQDKLNKKAEIAKNRLLHMAEKGKTEKVNKVLNKVDDSVKNVSNTAKRITDITSKASSAKGDLKKASDETSKLVKSNNIVPKKPTEEKPAKKEKPVKEKPAKPEIITAAPAASDTSAKPATEEKPTASTNAPANGQPVRRRPLGRRKAFTESLTLKMPEDIIIVESNNYSFFLEQVLEYNGFKVNENNVNVLAEALENGHATIE